MHEQRGEPIGSVRRRHDRVGAEGVEDGLDLAWFEQLAGGRPGQMQAVVVGAEQEPCVGRRLRERRGLQPELAEQAEVNVYRQTVVEPVEDVLAPGVDRLDDLAVDRRRPLGEPTLR